MKYGLQEKHKVDMGTRTKHSLRTKENNKNNQTITVTVSMKHKYWVAEPVLSHTV